jgi:hypothetical protein
VIQFSYCQVQVIGTVALFTSVMVVPVVPVLLPVVFVAVAVPVTVAVIVPE